MKGLVVLPFIPKKRQNKPNLFVTAMLLQNELEKVVRLFFICYYNNLDYFFKNLN